MNIGAFYGVILIAVVSTMFGVWEIKKVIDRRLTYANKMLTKLVELNEYLVDLKKIDLSED